METLIAIAPYIPSIIIVIAMLTIIILAHNNKEHNFSIYDYFLDPSTKMASITRTGQTLGILTATWVVVKLAATGGITVEILGVYMAALGISEGWSKFVSAKFNVDKE